MWALRGQFRFFATRITKAAAKGPPLPPLTAAVAEKESRTMLGYIYDIQQKFPDAVVMAQVGAFIELYFDQAVDLGPKLNLKVARKNQSHPKTGQPFVNMAGFPLQHKEKYEKMIVNDFGKPVVSLMQDSRFLSTGGSEAEKRPVTRILTPGTLLAESFVDASKNNYLCCVNSMPNGSFCVMWMDVASGNVKYEIAEEADLGNTLTRIGPSEILVSKTAHGLGDVFGAYAPQAAVTRHAFPPIQWWNTRASISQRFEIESLGESPARAFVGLVSYIDECMPGSHIVVQHPTRFFSTGIMQMDARTREALELTSTTDSGTRMGLKSLKGSLLSVIRRTKTQSGARLLQEWLTAPLQDPLEISKRQDKVEFFLSQSQAVLTKIELLLADLPDGSRTLQKMWRLQVDPLDLLAIAKSVHLFNEISQELAKLSSTPVDWHFDISQGLLALADEISSAIDPTALVASSAPTKKRPGASSATKIAPATNKDYIPVISRSYSPVLEQIYARESGFNEREARILERVQETYGPSADLRWSPAHQFYVYVVANGANEPDPSLLLGRSKTTMYIADLEWSKLGVERLDFSSDLRKAEEQILWDMRTRVVADAHHEMWKLYALGDEIDVQLSLATLAMEKRLVRPKVVNDPEVFKIQAGRHITVEAGLATGGYAASGFVANDCDLSVPQPICMITGPNMGGKSTYIRQNAVIAVLAHIGSFVPAKSAEIGVIDRIFCRIGAGDDLYNGRSTFMMEMLETSAILNNATEKSLAILDEVGRGTSGSDAIAIAFATINNLKCRTLFATHYGSEIAEHADSLASIRMLQASLRIDGQRVRFNYKLKPGLASSSYGLLIAKLAGFPEKALNDAQRVAKLLSNPK